jgi:ABC-2 type transport system permease protein
VTGLGVIWRRELAGLFLSPLAWVLLCLALFSNGFFFLGYLESQTGGEVNLALIYLCGGRPIFWLIMLLLPPLLTMRMISEEARTGLLEYLLTAPVSDAAVVLGKALATTTFLALLWACAPLYALVLQLMGAAPDWGQVATSYLGIVLLSGLLTSIGLVASAATDAPLLAAFVSGMAGVLLIFVPTSRPLMGDWDSGLLDVVIPYIDVAAHLQGSFLTGALDSAHVVFFVAWTAALLFVAVRLLESRRWR